MQRNVLKWALAAVLVLSATNRGSAAEPSANNCSASDLPPATILYLNFDGGALVGDGTCEDARANCSLVVGRYAGGRPVFFPPFSGDALAKAAIISHVRRFFAPFRIEITTTRPQSGIFEMAIIGGRAEDVGWRGEPNSGVAAGMAVRDCGNRNGANIAFAFADTQENDPLRVATVVAQEAGHAFGLGHVSDDRDVMRGAVNGQAEGFLDAGLLVAAGETCGGATCQNNALLLGQTLGLACGQGAALPMRGQDQCVSPLGRGPGGGIANVAAAHEEVMGCSISGNDGTPLVAAFVVLATGLLMVLASLRWERSEHGLV